MSVEEPSNIYREQLSSLSRGLALWKPNPVDGVYNQVSIGDVGYISEGAFIRMFNITLSWDDQSNNALGEPCHYDPLRLSDFAVSREPFGQIDYCSPGVDKEENAGNIQAFSPDQAEGVTYKCRGRGALLSLPCGGLRQFVIHRKVFEGYIRKNVGNWFNWSKERGLPVEYMEDLVLVYGCTLVTSWAAATFNDYARDAQVSLASRMLGHGGASFVWRNTRGTVEYHDSQLDSNSLHAPQNRCVFIRYLRAKRVLFWTRHLRGAAEPLPDDPDNSQENEIQVTQAPDVSRYRDPLNGVLDYIVEKCLEDATDEDDVKSDVMAITHHDDLQLINDSNMEVITADAVEQFLRENDVPLHSVNGTTMLRHHLWQVNEQEESDKSPGFFSPGTDYSASTTANRGSDAFNFSSRPPAKMQMPLELVLARPPSDTQRSNRGDTGDQSTVNPDNIDASDVLPRPTVWRLFRLDVSPPRLDIKKRIRRLTGYPRSDTYLMPFNVYRDQLTALSQGLALWNPSPPRKIYNNVSIGDVGYLQEGTFIRMFNVMLPWDDPSNRTIGLPEPYELLDCAPFTNTRTSNFYQTVYHTPHVFAEENDGNMQVITPDDARGVTYRFRNRGALLSLPHGGRREDVIRTKVFEDYIRDHVVSWFNWAQKNSLGVERMEELILVTGCTLVASWAAATLVDNTMEGEISLASRTLNNGGASFVWSNIRGPMVFHNSHFDPSNSLTTLDQCVFIRGFRAKRSFFRIKYIRAAAEPLPDDPDNSRDDEIQVSRAPVAHNYCDPLIGILDYIVEKCSEDAIADDIIAIAHHDDLQLINDVETLTSDAIKKFLLEKKPTLLVENGGAILRNSWDNKPPVSNEKRATFHAAAQVPLVKPVLTSLAVYAPTLSLNLENYQGYPQLITIETSGDFQCAGITVQDVLRTIHEGPRISLPRREIRKLGVEERVGINNAFGERRKGEEEELGRSPRRSGHFGSWDRLQILP